MKVLYLHQYFNTPEMMGGTRSYEIGRRLVSYGCQVDMVTSERDRSNDSPRAASLWRESTVAGMRVHWVSIPYSNSMGMVKRVMAFLKFAIASTRKGLSIDADIVFATSTPLTIAIPAIIVCKAKKIPMVFEVRDLWPELPIAVGALRNPFLRFLARFLEMQAYRHAEHIIALSPGMKEGVVERGIDAEKVSVISNSADLALFQEGRKYRTKQREKMGWLGGRRLVLYAGTLGEINGVSYLVELAAAMRSINKNVCFLIVGEGKEKDIVTNKASNLGVLGENLYIWSGMSKSEMPRLFSAADIVASVFLDKPEMRANSANKFFDSLAASKPIFINYGGWQHDLVIKRGVGISSWNIAIERAAKLLSDFLEDDERLQASSQAAGELARLEFDRDVLAEKAYNVLRNASGNGSRG